MVIPLNPGEPPSLPGYHQPQPETLIRLSPAGVGGINGAKEEGELAGVRGEEAHDESCCRSNGPKSVRFDPQISIERLLVNPIFFHRSV